MLKYFENINIIYMVKAINIFFNHVFVYRKIPKISPGAYILQQPFSRGLFLEGLS